MVNCTLKEVVRELRCNELYRNGNIVLFKNSNGQVFGRVIKSK